MCDSWVPLRLAAVCAALVLTPPLAASQSPASSPEVAAQRARVDSLIPEWRSVSRELHHADSVRRARMRARTVAVDTAVIGPFLVIARASESREHFRNVRKAVAARSAMLAGIPEERRATLFLERDLPRTDGLRFQAERANAPLIRIFGSSPRQRLRHTRAAVDDAIGSFLPPGVQGWLTGVRLSHGRESAAVYRELATSPAAGIRACFDGTADACISALRLAAPVPDDASFGASARASFVIFTLARGGDGAVMRLHEARNGSVVAALEHAGGSALPHLVRGWREELAQRYVSHPGLSRSSIAAFFWAAMATLIALRSTRRRAE